MKKRIIELVFSILFILILIVSCSEPTSPELNESFSSPFPANNATNQETDLILSWVFDGEADYFEVYSGENSTPTNKVSDCDTTFYFVEDLDELTTYYWRIVAIKDSVSILNSPIWKFTTKENTYFSSPFPANNSTNQETDLTLSWDFDGEADYFKLYFGENQIPDYLYADSLLQENFQISGLMLQTNYYWKVVAVVSENSREINKATKTNTLNVTTRQPKNGKDKSKNNQTFQRKKVERIKSENKRNTEIESPIWNFETRYPSIEDGYKLYEYLVQTELPSYVNIMFQVTDMEGIGVDNLETSDFEVKEDDQPVSPTESAMNIKKKDEINYTLKTVLMLDNSASVTSNLETIKESAISLVENITNQQEIAIYSFSESVNLLQDFTDDVSNLTSAINSIQAGYPSTNLYGAIIEGVGRWDDFYNIDEIEQGVLIALTDGDDTQGSSTLNEALSAIEDKNVYMVGLGNEMEPEILQQLGTAGFFYGIQIENLVEIFIDIQNEITAFANSFYWLNYMSPKREGNHTLTLTIPANYNTGDYSSINSNFSAEGFYGVLPGIALNVDPENGYPEGIENLTIPDENSYLIEATTFFGSENPIYEWSVIDESIAAFTIDPLDNSKIYIFSGGTIGSTILNVIDSANNFSTDIDIFVEYGSGILLNATEEYSLGISTINLQPDGNLELIASSVFVENIPIYSWTILDENIATIIVTGDSTATITAVSEEGETILHIEDTANNLQRDFPVSINILPTDGLIAYYPFNGNANDESGNGNDGTVYGATLATDRFGNENNAYSFDGQNDYIDCGNGQSVNISGTNSEITMSCWFKANDVNSGQNLISKGRDYTSNYGYHLNVNNNKNRGLYRLLSGENNIVHTNDVLLTNNWYHVLTFFDGNESKIYLNGISHNTTSQPGEIGPSSTNLIIGCHSPYPPTWYTFDGIIDDIRIYNRALSENEVQALYNEGGWDN